MLLVVAAVSAETKSLSDADESISIKKYTREIFYSPEYFWFPVLVGIPLLLDLAPLVQPFEPTLLQFPYGFLVVALYSH